MNDEYEIPKSLFDKCQTDIIRQNAYASIYRGYTGSGSTNDTKGFIVSDGKRYWYHDDFLEAVDQYEKLTKQGD